MTALESIPKVASLITSLIERVKDGKTAALVQQIQQHQFVIQTDLMDANAKISKMEAEHPKEIKELKESHRQEMAALADAHSKAIAERDAQITNLQKPSSSQFLAWGAERRIKDRFNGLC